MAGIEARLKDLLDETRLVMLGAQLLIGLQFQAAFTPLFERLPDLFRWLHCLALLLIIAAAALLLAIPAMHQIGESGHATRRIMTFAARYLEISLLPLSLALGMDVSIALAGALGPIGALAAAVLFAAGALAAWYGVPFGSAARQKRREEIVEDKEQSLEARIVQALTEIRVILPGAQALFGFQFAAVLTERFTQLSPLSRGVHLVSLGLVAISVVLLIAPAAYHRIAARGDAEEAVLRYAVRMMLPAEGLLALGIVGDAYVVVRKVVESHAIAVAFGIAAAIGFAVLLYGVPLASRRFRARTPAHAGKTA
jgi:hypothetical protein